MRIERGGLTYVTVVEAAQEFHYCSAYVSRLAQQGKVGCVTLGNRYFVKVDDLRDYAQRRREPLPGKQVKIKLQKIR